MLYKWNNPTLIVVAHTEGRDHLLEMTLPNLKAQYTVADIQVIDMPKGPFGPCAAWYHADIKDHHDFIIYTSDEILVPPDAVKRMRAQHNPELRSTPLLYFINRPHMPFVNLEDIDAIQQQPDFFNIYSRWGVYNRDMATWKHHVCFTGHTKEGWRKLGFPPPLFEFGEGDDSWLWKREHELGLYVNQIDLTVYHLFHGKNRQGGEPPAIWQEQNLGYYNPPDDTQMSLRVRKAKGL